ncbi:S-layer homology domain-containing protein [Paenibacillus alba]|uniref:S-layer homology domain-containing protein n=1 Tax=Paenibacillus alba TaxID=1197127 RepID=UPI001FE9E8FF|nr:S-layer homology domain-containing protein [Paenibacillus alba]
MLSKLHLRATSSLLSLVMVLSVLFTAIAPANQVFAANQGPVSVGLHVEGPQGLIHEGVAEGSNALEALQAKLRQAQIQLDLANSSFGPYVTGINGVQAGLYNVYDGWNFAVKRQGQWTIPAVGMDQFNLESNDEVSVYYGNSNTQLVQSISIQPNDVKANQPFSVTVTKSTYDWTSNNFVNSPADGVQVTVGGTAVVTNPSGVAVFDKGVSAGNYSLEVSDYRINAPPGIVRAAQPLTVNTTSAIPVGNVTISVEKFTLGQGYSKEPVKVPFYEGENGAAVLTRVLGEDNIQHTGSIEDRFYLSKVKDTSSQVKVPNYIKEQMDADGVQLGTKNNEQWLGEFDYTSMSGWMYAVNNAFPNVGLSEYIPHDGDVLRTQFTVYGFGASLGGDEWNPGFIQTANKDALTARIAEINSDPNKAAILSNAVVNSLYDQAYSLLTNMESKQNDIDSVLASLQGNEKPTIKVTGLTDKQEVSQANISFNVEATDNTHAVITPVVKLNGTVISKTGGTYNVVLNMGVNTIAIMAKGAFGNTSEQNFTITLKVSTENNTKEQLNKNLAYILKTVDKPKFGTGGGEWSVLSLARAKYSVPDGYYQFYYDNVVNTVKEKMIANAGVLDKTKGTEHSRVILGLTSIGKDPKDVGGYDLLQALSDYDYVLKQGMNGPIFALLAFDSKNYIIPTAAEGKVQTTRDKLIEYLINGESNKGKDDQGGWGLSPGGKPDVDLTGMTMQALAPYAQSKENVKAAIDRAVSWLSKSQNSEGSYTSFGSTSSESLSQVVTALSAVGLDSRTDTRFIKNGQSALDALMSFTVADGGFKHVKTGKVDGMATDQGTYALVAYDRFLSSSNRLYDMTDVDTEKPQLIVNGLTNNQEVSQAALNFGVEVTDNKPGVITPVVKLNGTVVSKVDEKYSIILRVGANTIAVTATDSSDNTAEKIYTITFVDAEKPELIINGLTNNQEVSQPNLSFSVGVTDNSSEVISPEVKLNGTVVSKVDEKYSIVLHVGANTIAVTATDSSGNTAEQICTVTFVDAEKPKLIINGLTNNQEVSQPNLSFSVSVTDNSTEVISPVVKLNGAVISKVEDKYSIVLNAGANTITVSATDSSGNTDQQSFTITYKATTVSKPKELLNKNLAYMVKTIDKPAFGTGGGEWSVLSLARANYSVPEGYYQFYYNNVEKEVKQLMTENSGVLDKSKGTEHSRAILGLASIGKNPRKVGGYDLTQALADYDYVIKQGINGSIFALIAFDTKNFDIPVVSVGKNQVTKEKLINHILEKEVNRGTDNAGGWTLIPRNPADVDITSMALQALAPYYHTRQDVKSAGDRAIAWLAKTQGSDGGFGESSESIAQVITALTALGIDPSTDERFIKNGISALDAFMSFAAADGGFKHVKTGKVDGMATDQGTYALVAYDRFVNGSNRLYDMTDVIEEVTPPVKIEIPVPTGDKPRIEIPSDNQDYFIPIANGDASKEISIRIPSTINSKIQLNLPSGSSLPQIEAVKGNVSMVIPKGAQISSGDGSALDLITSNDTTDSALRDKLNTIIPTGKKLDSVNQAITIGGNARVEFTQFITLTFTGMKDKEAAFIQNGSLNSIQKFGNDEAGKASGKNEYVYDSGNNLIVKTKHFTDFIAFSTSTVVVTPGGPGGTNPPITPQVTLSVDKLTINKGYVISESNVELKAGDSVWSVFQRELNSRGISYTSKWFDKYNSIYVESIDGDGEFDHGSGSGWMYSVNGTYPGFGASSYVLKQGDRIQWRYTTNLGVDLGVALPNTPLLGASGGIIPNDKKQVIEIPANLDKDYTLNITKEMKDKDQILVNIPNVKPKVILNLEAVQDNMPQITATKGDITVSIDKGTALKSGDRNVEFLTSISTDDTNLINLVQSSLNDGSTNPIKLNQAFAMGNADQSVIFDKPLTFIIKGAKNQHAGFIEGNTFTPIKIYESDAKGSEATKGNEKITYAFIKDNDLIIKTNHFTKYVSYSASQLETEKPFDLKNLYADTQSISNWAMEAINEASQKAFIDGSNGKFNPQATITRAEFTKILVGVLGIDVKTDPTINFKDVSQNEWFYPYVNAAYKAGFITGFTDDQFNPDEKLTREQMAVIIVKALGIQAAGQTSALADMDQVSDWAKADVQTVIARQLMSGWDNRFQPSDEVTREMATVVAMRAYHDKKDHPKETNQPDLLKKALVEKQISQTAAFMQQTVTDPVVASIGGDWTVFGLARSGVPVPDAYYAKYYANVEKILKEKSGKLHAVKYTEYDRVILGLTSIGRSIDQVAGYNLREWLADYDTLIKQGINGPIFALIALDSKSFDIPTVASVKTQTTRELLIDFILKREITGGGWALGDKATEADPDITAMAIQGLTPYYQTNKNVQVAVDRAVEWLSKAQKADGGYASWESTNSESIAQVVVALAGLGINPHTDARFIKNGSSALDALLSFAALDGGFYHIKSGGIDNGGAKPGEVDLMATDQSMYALVAYDRLLKGQTRLYDMTDIK